jgi:VCBS repeat protein
MIKLLTRVSLIMLFVFRAHAAVAATVPSASFPTIQSAINAVVSGALPNGTEIDVQPGTYTEFLLVNTTAKSMTVRGISGPASTVVTAPGPGLSVLRVLNATGAVRFEGLTFQHGGGVPGQGGGFTAQDSSPTFFNCIFSLNTAPSGGGGVLTRSNAVFDTVVFQDNRASSFGGGIVITTGSRPVFVSSQFNGNISGTTDPTGSGGGVHVNDASATFRSTSFNSNQSTFAGGGILVIGLFGSPNGTSTLVLEDCTVANNRSVQAAGQNPSEGGGVHIEDNTIAYVTRTRVVGNIAQTGGGLSAYRARYEIFHSIIENNAAPGSNGVGGFGGGIDATSNNVSGTLRQASTVILNDTAIRGNTALIGGGILIVGDNVCSSPSGTCNPSGATKATLTMTDTLFDSNTASSQAGAIAAGVSVLTVTRSHIVRNTVTGAGTYGGGLMIYGSTAATITDATIASNSAPQFGGGIFLDTAAALNVTDSRIYKNSSGTAFPGGGIYVNSGGGSVSNSVIADNANFQIGEQSCSPAGTPILTYTNNTITPFGNGSDVYKSVCAPPVTSIAAFNSLANTSGNNSNAPNFATFMATPGVGPTSVLSWAVARATAVSINGATAVSSAGVGAKDVSPAARTTYTITSSPASAIPAGSASSAVVTAIVDWGALGDVPVRGDFDGDGKPDIAVYRPSTGDWFILRSAGGVTSVRWGAPALGDIPVPADYDGDGKADIAVFRRATGEWLILLSAGGVKSTTWGAPSLGDTPLPADYDGDGEADLAVYRASTGNWFVLFSSGSAGSVGWGDPASGDVPVPADYDGDGKTDAAVYRTSTGQWFILPSTGGVRTANWGAPSLGDVPVSADYDGDGKADLAVMRQATGQWFVLKSSGGSLVSNWGAGAALVPGDYDFNRLDDVAVWLPTGRWVIQR